jgi:hypothetical protein
MSSIKSRIEESFGGFARFVYRNRIKTLLVMLAVVLAIVSQGMPNVTVDTSTEGFLHEDDPALISYNAFRDQFGRDEMVIIAIKPKEVFDLEFLRKLKDFHTELASGVPHLDDITSLVNARNTRGVKDRLIVEDLLESFPRNDRDLASLKARVMANPIYRNMLISEDGTFTTVVIKTNSYSSIGASDDALGGFDDEAAPSVKRQYFTDAENSEVVRAVREIAARYDGPGFALSIAGSPVVTNDVKQAMMKDMPKFMAMALLVIAVVLYVLFRRLSGVLLPLFIVIVTLLSTIGLMGLAGKAIKVPTQILPSILLAVSVGAAVHVLAIFFHRFQNTGDKEGSIVHALGHSGLAIVMTSLTTAGGLASFATAEIAPVADLGMFAAIGVMLSLLYTIVLLPALLALVPVRIKTRETDKARHARMDRVLTGIADFSTRRPGTILTVGAFITVIALVFSLQIRFSHDTLSWLNKSMPVRLATTTIDKEMKGSVALEVVTDIKKTNGLYEPEHLSRLNSLAGDVNAINQGDLFVSKTIAVTDILKEINQALNENREEYYSIPQNRTLVAQEFLLFENSGSDDLEDVVDSQFSKARFTVKLPWLDAVLYRDFIAEMKSRFKNSFGDDAGISVTGMIPLFGATVHAAMDSAVKSYVIAFVAITIMMVLFIGDVRMGLVSMIPNLMPIILTMGIMGAFDLPMDLFNMLIGAIAIGLAVDDTIHFMHNFRRYFHETHDVREAVRQTLLTTGRAMLVTGVVLSLGFFIFTMASLYNLQRFGVLTGFTIITALVADFLIAPALMMVLHKPKEWE